MENNGYPGKTVENQKKTMGKPGKTNQKTCVSTMIVVRRSPVARSLGRSLAPSITRSLDRSLARSLARSLTCALFKANTKETTKGAARPKAARPPVGSGRRPPPAHVPHNTCLAFQQ